MKKEEATLAQLLKTVKLDKPSSTFTEDLMDYLMMEEQILSDKKSILHQKLDRSLIQPISDGFTSSVIIALEDRESVSLFRPLISKRYWIVIFTTIILCASFFLYGETLLDVFSISERALNQIEWFNQLFAIPSLLSISVLAFSSLLLLDFFLERKNFQ